MVYSRPFATKAVFWCDFEWIWVCQWLFFTIEGQGWKPCFERVPALGRFSPKIPSLRFQTSQHKGQKIHDSSRTFQWKIHLNGPELPLEENQNPTVFERLEYIARSIRASHKQSCWLPLSDWMMLDRCSIREGQSAWRYVAGTYGSRHAFQSLEYCRILIFFEG